MTIMKLFEVAKSKVPVNNLLSDKFIVPPFTVLDSRMGYWSKRKADWKNIGIKSELGRGDYILDDEGNFIENTDNKGNCMDMNFEKYGRKAMSATSIFDPVLCEIAYRWFTPKKDNVNIIDPFAGGSVRGIVASCLNLHYTGIDLREEQVKSNIMQFNDINKAGQISNDYMPNWICGNSLDIDTLVGDKKFDLLFTCPPYYDLEIYSDNPNDLSNLDSYEDFIQMYSEIIIKSCRHLNDNSFAIIVVGEIRDKKGIYRNFVGDTISILQKAGLSYYNEAIFITPVGTLPLRVPKQFNAYRKLGKEHQNVIVFYKGDTKSIKDLYREVVNDDLTAVKIV